MTFQNRIIDYGVQPADQFLAHPKNARMHPQFQRDVMKAALETVGFVAPVIVAKSGYLLDGHERVWQGLQHDNAPIPYVTVDVDEDEEAYVLATFDPITSLATYEQQKLDDLLRDVQSDDASIQQLLSDLADAHGLYLDDEPTPDPGAQIDKAEELQQKWQVVRGDLWAIGEHRLLCGDSTSAEDVARVIGGEKADMMFTDPPYGVDYRGGHFHSGNVNIVRQRDSLKNDDCDIYNLFIPIAIPMIDGPCYVFFAGSRARSIYNAVYDSHCEVHALIIWHKINAKYAAMNAQYKQRHEPLLYFKPNGTTLRWVGRSDECTLWEMPRDAVNDNHPTQKPVALPVRAINNHNANTVFDPFLGSGTTLVACEQTGRRGRGVEIEPKYCAVALERLSQMGLEARRVSKA